MGAPLSQAVREEFFNVTGGRLLEGYGLTECSPVVVLRPDPRRRQGRLRSANPFPGTDIRFCDVDEPHKEVAPGERGEIQVRGPQVMAGYYEDEAATQHSFVDGWLRTGDVGYVDEEGHVYLVDRIKDLIISSGFNVYPRVIEEVLESHDAVEECNVIGVLDDYRGEAPVAFVKLVKDARVTDKELKSFLVGKISRGSRCHGRSFSRTSCPRPWSAKLSKNELRADYARMKGHARWTRLTPTCPSCIRSPNSPASSASRRAPSACYEAKGLISPKRVGSTRVFRRRDRARLILIPRGKRLGFTLREISEYLGLYDIDPSQSAQTAHLDRQVGERIAMLERQLSDLQTTLRELRDIKHPDRNHAQTSRHARRGGIAPRLLTTAFLPPSAGRV